MHEVAQEGAPLLHFKCPSLWLTLRFSSLVHGYNSYYESHSDRTKVLRIFTEEHDHTITATSFTTSPLM